VLLPSSGFAAEAWYAGRTNVSVAITYLIDARDKPGLFIAVARALAGGAEVSFEGELSCCDFKRLPKSSSEETVVLRRNTRSPRQDFVVLPLELDTLKSIVDEVLPGGRIVRQIIHVQISKLGYLAFGAYDNFHRDCTVAFDPLLVPRLDALCATGVIRSYSATRGQVSTARSAKRES
jgi:hypothetical protein